MQGKPVSRGEEDKIGVAVALGVDAHAVGDAHVEVRFDHATRIGFEQEGTEGTEIFFSCSVTCLLLLNLFCLFS
jgi:hypothetical protein